TLMTHAGVYLGSGVTLSNAADATWETQDNSGFAAQDGASGEQLVNAGTLLRTTTGYDAQNNVILVPFVNTGTVDAKSGSLYVSSPYLQSAGSTVLDGGNLAGQLDIESGLLEGSGTIFGSVSNGGQVSPGFSSGLITVQGNYTQTSTGDFAAEIGGL